MLVLHVNDTPPGGVINYLRGIVREQVRRGYEVHLLSPDRAVDWPGVTAHRWALSRPWPTTYPTAVWQYQRVLRELKPDVVHLHSFWAGQFGRLPLSRGASQVPVVYQPHAWSFDRYESPVFRRLVWAMERSADRRTAGIVANCWDEIAEGRSAGVHSPGQALGVPLDTERFVPCTDASRSEHRERLGLSGRRMLLCLGRIARQKGQDQLVAAWEANPIPDTDLVLVGVGDDSPLRALAPTQWDRTVRRIDAQDDVRPWIWACDVLVQPSRYETVGLAIAEAMSCGRPVVATRANGVSEVVGELPADAAGAVVELGAMQHLLAECARRLDDAELWQREAQQARQRALVQFAPSQVVDRLERAYLDARQFVGAQR